MSRCAFTRVLGLPGWSGQSVWGYDELLECYWAQLWRDDGRFDEPWISISSYHLLPTVAVLARVLADRVGIDDDRAWLALIGPRPIGQAETASRNY
ncbi:MAG: hypothetical protein ACOH2F_20885 [Cellulomonas sp.]